MIKKKKKKKQIALLMRITKVRQYRLILKLWFTMNHLTMIYQFSFDYNSKFSSIFEIPNKGSFICNFWKLTSELFGSKYNFKRLFLFIINI